jgi:hypothetical protein
VGLYFSWVNWLQHEGFNSSISGANIKNVWRYTSAPFLLLNGVILNEECGQLIFSSLPLLSRVNIAPIPYYLRHGS